MQCVILAGGLGTRMKSISGELPKALLPVGPRTFIDWQLEWLKLGGVTRATLALGHEGKRIESHLTRESLARAESYPQLEYEYDGKELLGTGGAIARLASKLDANFLVTYGDSFLMINPGALFKAHVDGGAHATMSVFCNRGQGDASNVELKDGRIARYDKKNPSPAMDHIDYGMMAFEKSWFLSRSKTAKFDLAPLLTAASEKSELEAFVAKETFREIGSPLGYQGFCELLASVGHDLKKLRTRL